MHLPSATDAQSGFFAIDLPPFPGDGLCFCVSLEADMLVKLDSAESNTVDPVMLSSEMNSYFPVNTLGPYPRMMLEHTDSTHDPCAVALVREAAAHLALRSASVAIKRSKDEWR